MRDNERIINEVLNSCLTGYSIYDDDIVNCITKENRSLLRGLSRLDWLRLLCDVITMAYKDGQNNTGKQIEVTTKVTETNSDDDKLEFSNLINRDLYKQMKSMNRREFTDFLFDLYKSIYEERESKISPDFEILRNEILKINGIGSVKADAVMEAVKSCLESNIVLEHDK